MRGAVRIADSRSALPTRLPNPVRFVSDGNVRLDSVNAGTAEGGCPYVLLGSSLAIARLNPRIPLRFLCRALVAFSARKSVARSRRSQSGAWLKQSFEHNFIS